LAENLKHAQGQVARDTMGHLGGARNRRILPFFLFFTGTLGFFIIYPGFLPLFHVTYNNKNYRKL
tara:strand:+ start:152 stop:346 length:195 start_codon:yes stop_codon:yes gene_type:complete